MFFSHHFLHIRHSDKRLFPRRSLLRFYLKQYIQKTAEIQSFLLFISYLSK